MWHSCHKRGDIVSDFIFDGNGIRILEIVMRRDYTSLEFLSEALGVSTRTIRNYIKQVNDELQDIATLKNKRGKGYWLSIKSTSQFNHLMRKISRNRDKIDSPKRRIAFIIDRLINSDKNYTLDELAFELNIGRTTLINELAKASVSLASYNLKIYGKQNTGMKLSYQEHDLRFFILENIYDILYVSSPLDQDIADEIENVATHHDLEASTKKKLFEFIVVMLERLLKKHPLEKVKEEHLKLLHSNDLKIAGEICSVIERKLSVKIPKAEMMFISIPIAGRRTPTNNRTMTEIQITDEVKGLLAKIIEQIGFKQEIVEENPVFFLDLQYHLTFMLNRLMFGLRLNNPMLRDVKEKYPVAFKMAKIAGNVIEREYSINVSEDELGYIAFYFEVFISQNDYKVKHFRKAAVVCGTGRGTAKLIKDQLQRILSEKIQLDILSETEITKEQLNDYDIVFSTVKLLCKTDTPVIKMNEIFDENMISKKIEEVAYMQSFKLDAKDNHNSILYHLITKDKFFILNSSVSYHDNLFFMVDQLVRKKYLDNDFKKRLKVREEKGSMVFDHFIALPHTFNEGSDSLEVALGVLPKKITADGREIRLIFLLGIPEQQVKVDLNEQQLINVYDEIIRIANNEQLINQLTSSTSYKEAGQFLKYVSKFN